MRLYGGHAILVLATIFACTRVSLAIRVTQTAGRKNGESSSKLFNYPLLSDTSASLFYLYPNRCSSFLPARSSSPFPPAAAAGAGIVILVSRSSTFLSLSPLPPFPPGFFLRSRSSRFFDALPGRDTPGPLFFLHTLGFFRPGDIHAARIFARQHGR